MRRLVYYLTCWRKTGKVLPTGFWETARSSVAMETKMSKSQTPSKY